MRNWMINIVYRCSTELVLWINAIGLLCVGNCRIKWFHILLPWWKYNFRVFIKIADKTTAGPIPVQPPLCSHGQQQHYLRRLALRGVVFAHPHAQIDNQSHKGIGEQLDWLAFGWSIQLQIFRSFTSNQKGIFVLMLIFSVLFKNFDSGCRSRHTW